MGLVDEVVVCCRSATLKPRSCGEFVITTATKRMIEHRFAKLAAVATFFLLIIGGTVNPTGSSLACPEPTLVCNGQLFPPMTGGVLYEHGHRLAAMAVGLLQIGLTILLLRRRKDLRWLAWLTLGMVISQGALGAITVQYKLPWFVSTGHLMLAMSYFAMLIYTAFRTRGDGPVTELRRHDRMRAELGATRGWIGVACGLIATQLLIGALVRHHGAAMACLGIPACTRDGNWWPAAAVQQLHMVHRGFGVFVAVVTITIAMAVWQKSTSSLTLRVLMGLSIVVVLAQIGLGVATVLTLRSVPVAVGHFAGAAGIWAIWMSAWFATALRRPTTSIGEDLAPTLPTVRAV
jgi:cytochrome c oxidase assembly protein subunit 15